MLDTLEVLDKLQALCEANPDRLNPKDASRNACLYQTLSDPTDNCLIGMLARTEGWQVPGSGSFIGASEAAGRCGWPVSRGAAWVMDTVQVYADGRELTPIAQRRWADVVPCIERERVAYLARQTAES